MSANVGATTLLSCLATGGKKVTYQWRMNEEKLPSKSESGDTKPTSRYSFSLSVICNGGLLSRLITAGYELVTA